MGQKMELHLKISGIILVLLAFIHIGFPRYFNWRQELSSLSLINRQMMTIHTMFIALMVLLIGILCLSSPGELISTSFGKKISLALGIFWTIRLFVQFFGYSVSLWRGKTFETIIHITFAFLWIYLSWVFLATYFK